MTVEQAVKVSNLLQELEAIDAFGSQIEMFLSNGAFESLPSKLANDIIALIDRAYDDKKKEIEEM